MFNKTLVADPLCQGKMVVPAAGAGLPTRFHQLNKGHPSADASFQASASHALHASSLHCEGWKTASSGADSVWGHSP